LVHRIRCSSTDRYRETDGFILISEYALSNAELVLKCVIVLK